VRGIGEACGLDIKLGKIYKVKNVLDSRGYELENVYGMIYKCFMKDCTILDVDLQRVNNVVVGTLNYVDDKFKEIEEIKLSTSINQRNIFLYDNSILLTKRGNGMSDTLHFNSAQEAQDYIDKFTMIIDDINMNQPETKYKINCDKLYSEEDMSKLKELGIDFTKVGE
jgi:hypothetical protein